MKRPKKPISRIKVDTKPGALARQIRRINKVGEDQEKREAVMEGDPETSLIALQRRNLQNNLSRYN